jgi:hypothetical protein
MTEEFYEIIIIIIIIIITPWSRVLLEKLTDPQLVKTFPKFYGIIIIVFTCSFSNLVTNCGVDDGDNSSSSSSSNNNSLGNPRSRVL